MLIADYAMHNFSAGGCWLYRKQRVTRSCKNRVRGFLGDLLQAGQGLHQAEEPRSTATGFPGNLSQNRGAHKLPLFRDCFEDELVPVFASVGRIYELRLMIEFSGTNRTYCYVR